jgi:glycosyltransferase involved in cell wall biosynthesis
MSCQPSSLVSVCIPVFNCESFISQTIQSVLDQTYTNLELIILDNASTDLTGEIVQQFKDSRIRYLRNETNIGMMGNWNKALDEAKGKYIKILPADDLIYPNCLETQVSAIEDKKYPNIALVCCKRDIINVEGRKMLARSFTGVRGFIPGKKAVKKIVRSGTNRLGEPGAILFRSDLLSHDPQMRFSNQFPYVIDLSLWIKLLSKGDLYVIQKSLCGFRVSPQSESVNSRHFHRDDFSSYIKSLDRKRFGLNSFDIQTGVMFSMFLEIMRRLFYKASKIFKLLRG